jgi:hypothetical protein
VWLLWRGACLSTATGSEPRRSLAISAIGLMPGLSHRECDSIAEWTIILVGNDFSEAFSGIHEQLAARDLSVMVPAVAFILRECVAI